MTRVRRPALALAAVLLLAGCGAAAKADDPTWVPAPTFNGEGGLPPDLPGGGGPPADPNSSPGPAPSGRPPGPSQSVDPFVVATKLSSPVGLTVLPDDTALVGERTTGRIVQVQPVAGKPVKTVRTLTGLSTTGDGGLLDLALSPNYAQDGLIFAYVSTPTDNRVITFTLTGPATPVLTGIPRAASGNTGRIVFGSDSLLYVGTGDAGQPKLAADPKSLAGKVLRVTDIGQPAAGNPAPASPVFTSGHHVVDGLCLIAGPNRLVEVEAGASPGPDEVNVLTGGKSYGWPPSSQPSQAPTATLPSAQRGPGGCAVLGNQLYVTSLDGKALLTAGLSSKAGVIAASTFTAALTNKYGRLRTVVADPANAVLWLTTSNRDGHGKPVASDERVLRIPPPGGGGSDNSPA
ncbi:MAG: PQQ-dependent sugar dehydrogenase [Pseudonocardiales bacterium]